jgi:hypothetical protein
MSKKDRILEYLAQGGIVRMLGCIYIIIEGKLWVRVKLPEGMKWISTEWTAYEDYKINEAKKLVLK